MSEDSIDKKIDFAKNILENSHNLITLIDTKAGLILGSAGIILGLLSFFDRSLMTENTVMALYATIGLLGITIIFSFLTIFPRITSKTKYETSIFFKSIIQQTKEEYREKMQNLTPEQILQDYTDNIFDLAKVQQRKFKSLRISLAFMILSAVSLLVTLYNYY